jgi:cytochrome c
MGIGYFGFGRPASDSIIAALDIDVRPDGQGLPSGAGNAAAGRAIFDQKCAACHGAGGIGGPQGSLVVHEDSTGKRPEKVIGNYWPYATTIFDYLRRAMPFHQPGSLSNEEVYHLTAYLLFANGITKADQEIDAVSLPQIVMPARQNYVPDDREGGPVIK